MGHPSVVRFVLYFLRLGATGFGGPIALAGAMRRDLVDERGWISPRDYDDGLALAQLAPGPLAAQLAMYLGYVRGGIVGATLAGLAFVLPSLLIVWTLSAVYVRVGGLPWMQAAFYGVGAAVIAIIARAAAKLAVATVSTDLLGWAIFLVAAAVTAITEREVVWLFLVAGALTWGRHTRAAGSAASSSVLTMFAPLVPMALPGASTASASGTLFWFFAKAGAVVFGSGLAIVPFLYAGVVQEHRWLTDRQFLDAVAVAMITPGPVVITVAFIGYLVDGTRGLLVAAAAVFSPVYLFVILPAPYFRRHRDRASVQAFVRGVTAAAAGAIAGASVVLAHRAIVDLWTIGIAVVAAVLLTTRRVPEPLVMAAAGMVGVALKAR